MSNMQEYLDTLAIENDHSVGGGATLFPEMVEGRVLHFDGDFLAYQGAVKQELSYVGKQKFVREIIEEKRLLAGAETIEIHLTPKSSTKGGRYDSAVLAEYQANRSGKEKPKDLEPLRLWLHNEYKAIMWYDREADDGLAYVAEIAKKEDKVNQCVLISKDKDINIIGGWHMNWDDGTLYFVTPWGKLWKDDKGKVRGVGTKFFWFQMLSGDTADNIKGLPSIAPILQMEYIRTKAQDTLLTKINACECVEKLEKLQAKVFEYKNRRCGDGAAWDLMSTIENDADAFALIYLFYTVCADFDPQKRWDTEEPLTGIEMFVSNALLLWMRRTNEPADFLDWMQEQNLSL